MAWVLFPCPKTMLWNNSHGHFPKNPHHLWLKYPRNGSMCHIVTWKKSPTCQDYTVSGQIRLYRRSCGLLSVWDDTRSNSVPAAPELLEVIQTGTTGSQDNCVIYFMGTKVSNSSSATCNFNHRCRQWSTDPEWLETGLSANWHQRHRLIFYSVRGLSNSCKALFDIN